MPNRIIVIPAYNEERTIADVVREAVKFADRVIVVDDGSRDRSGELRDTRTNARPSFGTAG